MSVKYRFCLVLLSLALGACTTLPSPRERQDHADNLATARQWQKGTLETPPFTLRTYEPATLRQGETLTVYIEGDGLAWLNPSQPSADPTPFSPLLLQLALAQREGKAAYLARPCQYAEPGAAPCAQRYWTDGRFAPEVIDAMDRALEQLKARQEARTLVLVGYSGGGAVAALLAARRSDVARLVTIAGNLDHRAWTAYHRLTPLDASLNPADQTQRLAAMSQIHWIGGRDTVMPTELARRWPAALLGPRQENLKLVPEASHGQGWPDPRQIPEFPLGSQEQRQAPALRAATSPTLNPPAAPVVLAPPAGGQCRFPFSQGGNFRFGSEANVARQLPQSKHKWPV